MLISVHNIKVTCEWHKDIKWNYKNILTRVIVILWVRSTMYTVHDTGIVIKSSQIFEVRFNPTAQIQPATHVPRLKMLNALDVVGYVHSFCEQRSPDTHVLASATHQLLTPGYRKQKFSNMTPHARTDIRLQPPGPYSIVRATSRFPHFSLAIIS